MTADETREKVERAVEAALDPDTMWLADRITDAAIAAYEAAQWRTIDSAPKDGTPILAYESGEPPCVVVATYRVNGGRTHLVWMSCCYEMADLQVPTHWRPLPPPPA